jgi:hypothetical protein
MTLDRAKDDDRRNLMPPRKLAFNHLDPFLIARYARAKSHSPSVRKYHAAAI